MADTKYKDIPLSGKFFSAEPASVGTNFQTLTNLRYTDTHLKGVQGMTKINVTALTTSLRARSAFHFSKHQPAESHIIAQVYNTAESSSKLLRNVGVIPATAAFLTTALWSDTASAGKGYFSDAPDGQMIYANSIDTCMWGGNEAKIGAFVVSTTAVTDAGGATNPIDYTQVVNNRKSDALNVATIDTTAHIWLIGTTRPVQAFTYDIATVNATIGTMTGKYHDGSAWQALALTDATILASAALGVNGSVSFATTVGLAKPRYLEGYYLYWYQFHLDDGHATIATVTMDAPFQPIVDMWDGVYRDIAKFSKNSGGTITDNTINVLKADFTAGDTSTYSDISSLAAYSAPNNCLIVSVAEKMTGLYFKMVNINSTPATVMSIDYIAAGTYTSAGAIVDGTSSGGISFALGSGVVTWNSSAITNETALSQDNLPPRYHYRVKFDQAIDVSCNIDYIGGIPASKNISYFRFPVFAQGRLLLCGDMAEDKNMVKVSSKFMPQVFNGADTTDVYFGDDGELTAGCELFSQFGSSLYSLVMMFKDNETWIMAGQDINQWENNIFLLSNTIGCPAPHTLKTVNLAAEPGAGINRTLAIWQGVNGVYMSDGRAPIPIHNDIKEYFDLTDSRCIRKSMIGDSVGFIDSRLQEYHLLVASGAAATGLNTELVYDIRRNKWFVIDRTVELTHGLLVHDTDGNAYNYGFLDTGYMERLENGTDFDGNDIVHTFQFGDFPLVDLSTDTRMKSIRLFTVAKTVTAADVTCTHYGNTKATGTDFALSPSNAGYRLADPEVQDKLNGEPFHSLKFTITTDNEVTGFEPLAVSVGFHEL